VTRAALQRWLYRCFLDHPTENRFGEVDFLHELRDHEFTPTGSVRRILFGDIFIGAAKLLMSETAEERIEGA
jgi:hypothetical protein